MKEIKNNADTNIINFPNVAPINNCRDCKHCCNPKENKIKLTPRDVFAIAVEFKLTPQQVLKKYCTIVTEGSFPQIYLNTTQTGCIFNKKKNCSLVRKPDICADFPYGDTIWFGTNPIDFNSDCQSRIIPPFSQLNPKEIGRDKFVSKWIQANVVCENIINKKKKESYRQECIQLVIYYLYERYDVYTPFVPQFDRNVLQLIRELD